MTITKTRLTCLL